jgi:hypothetical protein
MEAVNLDFTEEEEYWNIYKLADGTTLKVKLVLRGVKRLKRFNPDGTPMYLIQSQSIVRTTEIPEELLQQPKERSVQPV